MKKIIFKTTILLITLFASNFLTAQQDEESCKDHPLFNRMPNYYLGFCSENFNEFEIVVGNNKRETISGTVFSFEYIIKDGDHKQPSALQIMKNYENAILSKKGQKIYVSTKPDDDGFVGATFKLKDNGFNYWITLPNIDYSASGTNAYKLNIIKIEDMEQNISANEMFEKINSNNTLTLYINFDIGKSSIKIESQNIVDNIYAMLSENPDLKIVIEGHTDNLGNEKSNKILSEQRAESIKSKLITKGILKDRIKTAGFGQSNPIADNSTEDGKSKNRRVEIKKQ